VLASFAGSASALEFESDNGMTVNWNTTLSVVQLACDQPEQILYTHADGSLLGAHGQLRPRHGTGRGNGRAGNGPLAKRP